ncbi:type II toxin-antitoxin system VapC family toxin [Asticcacaulis sp.]|uniref:type II toxin-antitoxin system VapC family toxin n=1 Tax=Asticcacaulis sp. TaxID=1872648 RepID=UPI002CFEA2A2|nr:type II toxin-antitoxin system VapC family toxin [Asticcacaulis sp.]HTM82204.1 type II toxin-antitoxin system VapC family toxin [Asticcacaulis sp.]
MRLLLDTHALLWWLNDDPKLEDDARALILDPDNEILVSVVSLWEIAVKSRIGKLNVTVDDVLAVLPDQGFDRIGIEDAHLSALQQLPLHHRDPFDHLLLAQAMAEAAVFLTEDAHAASYGVSIKTCSNVQSTS